MQRERQDPAAEAILEREGDDLGRSHDGAVEATTAATLNSRGHNSPKLPPICSAGVEFEKRGRHHQILSQNGHR